MVNDFYSEKDPEFQIDDFSPDADSTVLIRGRTRGSKLEGTFSKKKGEDSIRIKEYNDHTARQRQNSPCVQKRCSSQKGEICEKGDICGNDTIRGIATMELNAK